MLSLTCRDFQVEFWPFFVGNCVKCEGIQIHVWLPCTVKRAGFQCKIYRFQVVLLNMCQFRVISPTICFRWNGTFHTLLCSCTWTVHGTLYAVRYEWDKMCRKCPQHPSSRFTCSYRELHEMWHFMWNRLLATSTWNLCRYDTPESCTFTHFSVHIFMYVLAFQDQNTLPKWNICLLL